MHTIYKTREYGLRAKCIGQTKHCYRNLEEREIPEGWTVGGQLSRSEPELISDGWGAGREE